MVAQIETDLPEEFMILWLKTRRPGKPLNNTALGQDVRAVPHLVL
jgi:hypothetical protein